MEGFIEMSNPYKKKKIEQSERHDGPQSHLIKEGTPTSGGIMCIVTAIILGIVYYVFPLGIPIEQKGIFLAYKSEKKISSNK